jgi:hypothetical protein
MEIPTLSVAVPASAVVLGIADERWQNWVEKGHAHDLLMRERWLQFVTILCVGIALSAAVVLGLQ